MRQKQSENMNDLLAYVDKLQTAFVTLANLVGVEVYAGTAPNIDEIVEKIKQRLQKEADSEK